VSYTSNKQKAKAALKKEILQAFKETVILVGVEATKEISKPQLWEGFSDVRDIVDLGQLRASQQIVFLPGNNQLLEAEIQYNTDYAAPVHNGATIRYSNGTIRRIQRRPWMLKALSQIDVKSTMTRLLRKR
jgi:hypothetical protein